MKNLPLGIVVHLTLLCSFQTAYGLLTPVRSSLHHSQDPTTRQPKAKPSVRFESFRLSFSSSSSNQSRDDDDKEVALNQKVGEYTVKQRLREEVESPFRTVRLFLFSGGAASALIGLYFSSLNALKAATGGTYNNPPPPLEESLEACAINLGAAIVCGFVAYRDFQARQTNLQRIAKGGQLAQLQVLPAKSKKAASLKDYRRRARVLIAAGGEEYLSTLALSLTSDQLADENILPNLLEDVDVVLVPVLLSQDSAKRITTRADKATIDCWLKTAPTDETVNRNFDINRANNVIAYPVGNAQWFQYLESEIKTAENQGFDVLKKGITIIIKKNGRILRRATGQPQFGNLINTMEVLDGSKFGMPGDSEIYGGP